MMYEKDGLRERGRDSTDKVSRRTGVWKVSEGVTTCEVSLSTPSLSRRVVTNG